MKIRMDVHEYAPGRMIAQRPARVMSAESNQGGNDIPQVRSELHLRTSLEQEKTLGEALAIAQMSQSLIQKALEISGRLRAIASRAMNTGSIDTSELTKAVSDASSSFAVHGEPSPVSVQVPVETSAAPELEELVTIGRGMDYGSIPGNERFDRIDRSLKEKNEVGIARQNELIHSMRELVAPRQWIDEGKVQAVLSDTGRKIIDNPSEGLMSHDRIRSESVIRLVG